MAFAQAIENAAKVKIPKRAAYLRTLFLELERLYNHVGDVGNICAGYGFAVGNSQGARMREQLLQLNERLSGHRYLRGAIALGGMKQDVTADEVTMITKELVELKEDFHELVNILLSHEIAVNRMERTGCLNLKQVTDLEVVGVAARASGRDIDCRRDLPYAAYGKVQFDVPVKTKGDVLRRIKIRIREVDASLSIIHQVLTSLPVGDICTGIPTIKPVSYTHLDVYKRQD